MNQDQRYRCELSAVRLIKTLRKKDEARTRIDEADANDKPELEKQLWLELAQLSRQEADCYISIMSVYD